MVQVKVQASVAGDRPAQVTLKTDSPLTPEVRFQLVVRTLRKPPFLVQSTDGLYFPDEDSYKTGIEFAVSTLQSPRDPLQPRPQLDHPKAAIRLTHIKDQPISDMGDVVKRVYTFRLTFSETPTDWLEGTLFVADPWNQAIPTYRSRVSGQPSLALEIAPQHIVWNNDREQCRVFIRCRDSSRLVVGQPGDSSFPFLLEPTEESEGKFRVFRLRRANASPLAPGIYSLPIKIEGGEHETARSLPITVTKGSS